MNEITIDEAVKRLKRANPYLYGEVTVTLGIDEFKEKSKAYESNGCVLIKQWSYYYPSVGDGFLWYLCDVGDSDMVAGAEDFRRIFGDEIKINYSNFLGDMPDDYDRSINLGTAEYLRLGAVGIPYNDPDIRPLSKSEYELLGLSEGMFESYRFREHEQLLGIFDGDKFAGAVYALNYNGELGRVYAVFVATEFRGRKYATRLIRAALALYPGLNYDYDCFKSNIASAASAKSAGFVVAGTHIPS